MTGKRSLSKLQAPLQGLLDEHLERWRQEPFDLQRCVRFNELMNLAIDADYGLKLVVNKEAISQASEDNFSLTSEGIGRYGKTTDKGFEFMSFRLNDPSQEGIFFQAIPYRGGFFKIGTTYFREIGLLKPDEIISLMAVKKEE